MDAGGEQRVLLVGDCSNELQGALRQAAPDASITTVQTIFEAIDELSSARYSTILAAAEPMERRPEAAVRTLRQVAGPARLLLFGHPTLEILTRKMLQFGCDDYVLTPTTPSELSQILGARRLRLAGSSVDSQEQEPRLSDSSQQSPLLRLPLTDLMLDALLEHPQDAPAAAIRRINQILGPDFELLFVAKTQPAPAPPAGKALISTEALDSSGPAGMLHLLLPEDHDQAAARHALQHLAAIVLKLVRLQDRHNRLQKLAITDDLTGVYNARYFRHFLSLIIDRARKAHFPVTLLLFDIDNFKKYNDEYGHATGDEILKQAAALMRRCTRQHDLVARIGGDEFAVIFWEKEGPRQPREPRPTAPLSRTPHEPLKIFERFRGLISSEEFPLLGQTGKGLLTVSAGMTVFPWDAPDAESLVQEADRRLVLGAKRIGKNAIYIVGTDDPIPHEEGEAQG